MFRARRIALAVLSIAAAFSAEGARAQEEAPADPALVEAAKRAAEEAARRQAEQEARDAAERLARRRASTIRRRTEPGAAEKLPLPTVSEADLKREKEREKEREALGGAELARTEPGTPVIVFEPPRAYAAAASAIALGRRTYARFDIGGGATASLTVTVAEQPERLALRLADVQRHVPARSEASRSRLLEGVQVGDWLRLRLGDGTFVSGRFVAVNDTTLRLRVPSVETPPVTTDVLVARIVQVDGLLASPNVARTFADLEPLEPVGLVHWPDGREIVGHVVDVLEHVARFDTNADGEPDAVVPLEGPIAEVRRIPPHWRQTARDILTERVVRVRGYEDYPDARVERVVAGELVAVTAYAVSVKLADGCAIVPFDSLVALDPASHSDATRTGQRVPAESTELPLLPGAPAAEAQSAELPPGISFVTDGHVVTHVYVSPAYTKGVCGLSVGWAATESVPGSEVHFGTEVIPKGSNVDRPRELISESIEGLRLVAYVDGRGNLSALELSQR